MINESTGVVDRCDVQPVRLVFCDQVRVDYSGWTCEPMTVTDLKFVWWYRWYLGMRSWFGKRALDWRPRETMRH
jgi:hypothetical protein